MKKIFRYQIWHLVSVIFLITATRLFLSNYTDILIGSLWGITARTWFWIAIAVPILHQTYVWLIWRLELHRNTFTARMGVQKAFRVFTIGFSLLFASRLISIVILGYSNRGTLLIIPVFAYILAGIITPIVIFLFYSVVRYFTMRRAYGIDHFDKNFNEPFVKKGIFRFTNNGMYVYGFMILYLPGLLLFSKAALLAALFNHLYIWVHYYTTERPDMEVIYGDE